MPKSHCAKLNPNETAKLEPNTDDSRLFTTLFQLDKIKADKIGTNANTITAGDKFKKELLEQPNLDSIDPLLLAQIIKFVNSDDFKRCTQFLNDNTSVFCNSTMAKECEPKVDSSIDYSKTVYSFDFEEFVMLTDKEESEALQYLLHFQRSSYNYEPLIRGYKKYVFHYNQNKLAKIRQQLLKTKNIWTMASSYSWSRFKQRVRIYHHYFLTRCSTRPIRSEERRGGEGCRIGC